MVFGKFKLNLTMLNCETFNFPWKDVFVYMQIIIINIIIIQSCAW